MFPDGTDPTSTSVMTSPIFCISPKCTVSLATEFSGYHLFPQLYFKGFQRFTVSMGASTPLCILWVLDIWWMNALWAHYPWHHANVSSRRDHEGRTLDNRQLNVEQSSIVSLKTGILLSFAFRKLKTCARVLSFPNLAHLLQISPKDKGCSHLLYLCDLTHLHRKAYE